MKFLQILSNAYYEGKPLVSNEVFDELAKQYEFNSVGTSNEQEIRHTNRLYSLQKVYPGDKIPFEGGIYSPKLDGAAVSIEYLEGTLLWAATRGDGLMGQDITDKIGTLVPNKINSTGRIQITGEIVTKLGKANIRNYASGAINLKDLEEFKKRDLYFFAYNLHGIDTKTYVATLDILEKLGFNTVSMPTHEFPKDGVVVRLNKNSEYEAMGYTSKHPKGAYALKENKEAVVTTLRNIEWSTTRTGIVAPVAILDPVDIDGAMVSRATLHNWAHIQELNLEPNCKVGVIRSGEIIPRIMERIYD